MKDDFLHRIRVNPPATFLATLKARLDGQNAAAPVTRQVRLRTWSIVTFLGGIGVAAAVMVIGGIHPWGRQMSAVPHATSSQRNIFAAAPMSMQSAPPESKTNSSQTIAAETPSETREKANDEVASAQIEMDWVLVPEGPFVMGATAEQKA